MSSKVILRILLSIIIYKTLKYISHITNLISLMSNDMVSIDSRTKDTNYSTIFKSKRETVNISEYERQQLVSSQGQSDTKTVLLSMN